MFFLVKRTVIGRLGTGIIVLFLQEGVVWQVAWSVRDTSRKWSLECVGNVVLMSE